jgi:hypothetical protein
MRASLAASSLQICKKSYRSPEKIIEGLWALARFQAALSAAPTTQNGPNTTYGGLNPHEQVAKHLFSETA